MIAAHPSRAAPPPATSWDRLALLPRLELERGMNAAVAGVERTTAGSSESNGRCTVGGPNPGPVQRRCRWREGADDDGPCQTRCTVEWALHRQEAAARARRHSCGGRGSHLAS